MMSTRLCLPLLVALLAPAGTAQVPNLAYGSKPFQMFDWYPAKHTDTPGTGRWALFLHGNGGNKADIGAKGFSEQLELLIWNGFTVFSANWTPPTTAVYPAQLEDAILVTQYLKANAATYDIDPDAMVMWGNSSGGTIAGWLVYGPDHKKASGSNLVKQSTRPRFFMNWGALTNFLLMSPSFSGYGFGVPTLSDLPTEFLESVSPSLLIDDVQRDWTPPVASYYGNVSDPPPYINPHDLALMVDLHAHLDAAYPEVGAQSMMLDNPFHPHTNVKDIELLTRWALDCFHDEAGGINLSNAKVGPAGFPTLRGEGSFAAGSAYQLHIQAGVKSPTVAYLLVGTARVDKKFLGGTLITQPKLVLPIAIGSTGKVKLSGVVPAGVDPGTVLYMQLWHPAAGVPANAAASNGLRVRFGKP